MSDVISRSFIGLAMSPKVVSLSMILFTVTTNAIAQITLKHGMSVVGPLSIKDDGVFATGFQVLFNPFVFLGLSIFVVSMASHLAVLSRVELSFAYPFLSLAYIMVAAFAFFVFGEDVGPYRLAGYGLICLGTLLIALS